MTPPDSDPSKSQVASRARGVLVAAQTADHSLTESGEERRPLIVVDSVRKSYRSKRSITHALDTTSLEIAEGEFVSVIGPSGCGKSTLLMMIAGLIPPTEGRIFVGGEEVTSAIDDVGLCFRRTSFVSGKAHSTMF